MGAGGGWRKFHNELNNLYPLATTIGIIIPKGMKYRACIGGGKECVQTWDTRHR